MSEHHRRTGWTRIAAKWRPRLAATLPAPCLGPCVLGGTVERTDTWEVGHVHPLSLAEEGHVWTAEDFAPIHAKCNRRDGGRMGAAITNAKKAGEDKRLFTWMST